MLRVTEPKALVAVNANDAGVIPVVVIPLFVELADTALAHDTEREVVFAPVVVGFATTPKVQLPPPARVAQPAAPVKVKFVVSPIVTLQAVALWPPEFERVTVVLELEVPVVMLPNGMVSGLNESEGAVSPVTVIPLTLVAAETPVQE